MGRILPENKYVRIKINNTFFWLRGIEYYRDCDNRSTGEVRDLLVGTTHLKPFNFISEKEKNTLYELILTFFPQCAEVAFIGIGETDLL